MRSSFALMVAATLGLVSLPGDAVAQEPATLAMWIEEARASPFHGDLSALRMGVASPVALRSGMAPLSDSAVSVGLVFRYTLVGAFLPMVPAWVAYMATGQDEQLLLGLGGLAVTLVSVPVAARVAGASSIPRALVATAVVFVPALWLGGAVASRSDDWFFVPVYSVTMALFTTTIAAR